MGCTKFRGSQSLFQIRRLSVAGPAAVLPDPGQPGHLLGQDAAARGANGLEQQGFLQPSTAADAHTNGVVSLGAALKSVFLFSVPFQENFAQTKTTWESATANRLRFFPPAYFSEAAFGASAAPGSRVLPRCQPRSAQANIRRSQGSG